MSDEINQSRRHFLTVATVTVGAVGVVMAAVPFVSSMEPSARAKALGGPTDIDISKIEPGGQIKAKWRGKPTWVVQRGSDAVADLAKLDGRLRDPNSKEKQQPSYCQNEYRAIKPELFVVVGTCTHLGCSPLYKPQPNDPEVSMDWPGGFFCPCHGSKYDLAGRVFKGVPAPLNLLVPPYKYVSDTVIRVGEDQGGYVMANDNEKRDLIDVTGGWLAGLRDWIDERFPMTEFWEKHVSQYYAPKNFNVWYFFGSIALLMLVNQIVTGIFLAMNYKPDANQAFASVEYIMRDVNWGWLIRYMHSVGASMFFLVVYLHMFRGVMYGSYKKPRELLWIFGALIYLTLMAEAFMGYLLPWGQMSYWGAQVIISIFGAIPWVGDGLAQWIRGDFSVSDITLNRFFALHVVAVPLVLIGLVVFHLVALHEVGSNNPDGVEIKKNKDKDGIPLDGIPFHPFYTMKDIVGVTVFAAVFAGVVFFAPGMHGLFLEPDNFVPANPYGNSPPDIHPLWYFAPYYAILRSIPNKLTGVVCMGAAILMLFLLPWLDTNPVKSLRYRGLLYRRLVLVFGATFLVLAFIGMQALSPTWAQLGQRCAELYFLFFIVSWVYSKPRSAQFLIKTFVVLMAAVTLADLLNIVGWPPVLHELSAWNPAENTLQIYSWLIPAIYCIVFLLVPAIWPRFNQPEQVPERVTH